MTTKSAGTHWRTIHRRLNPDLLYAEDLGGKPFDLEIVDSGVMVVEGQDGKKDMPWLAFGGAKKKLALNVSNCKTMQSITGTGVVEQWRGWITLITVQTSFHDKLSKKMETTDAIRISPKRPRPPEKKSKTSTEPAPPADPPSPPSSGGWDPERDAAAATPPAGEVPNG